MTVTGREQEGNFWGDGNILYLVWGSGDMILCIYQNSLNCALKICANHCTSFYLVYVVVILESLTRSVCILEVE